MDLKTKFDIEDNAFILFTDKIYEVTLKAIGIGVNSNNFHAVSIDIFYTIESNPAGSQFTTRFDESELFKTKEELAKHLINNSCNMK